jgi:hypothetical protein
MVTIARAYQGEFSPGSRTIGASGGDPLLRLHMTLRWSAQLITKMTLEIGKEKPTVIAFLHMDLLHS